MNRRHPKYRAAVLMSTAMRLGIRCDSVVFADLPTRPSGGDRGKTGFTLRTERLAREARFRAIRREYRKLGGNDF